MMLCSLPLTVWGQSEQVQERPSVRYGERMPQGGPADTSALRPEGRPSGPRSMPGKEYFQSEAAIRVGDQMLAYQRVTGGWPKNINMYRPMTDEQLSAVLADKNRRDDSTIDNGATTLQMRFLARLYAATGEARFREGFGRGLEYLLSGQYKNGGWPQFWPNPQGYQVHITYNDDAIYNTLVLFQQVIAGGEPYGGDLVDGRMRDRLWKSFDKGIEIILATQIVTDGRPTVWCQQHDRKTLAPARARSYELPSYCSKESVSLVRLLMSLPQPDDRVKQAVHGAVAWLDAHKIEHVRMEYLPEQGGRTLVSDPEAGPMWARFYDLEKGEPYVSDRDGIPQKSLSDIGEERRNHYQWYNADAVVLSAEYAVWADRFDPEHKVDLSF